MRLIRALPLLLLCVGCAPMSLLITPVPSSRALVEFEVERDNIWASKKVAIIDVEGTISGGRGTTLLGAMIDNPVSVFAEKLRKAAKDPQVKAVVLRVNSPGGGVTASEMMHAELLRFREKTGKPVVTSMLDLAASGGYYIACATDHIVAMRSTVTGSIGVIMITPDLSGTMSMIGARANVIKSAAMKDAGSPFRSMNAEDRAMFQGIIDSMYERFLEVVQEGRPDLAPDKLRTLADGSVYTSTQALQNGLVDEIGDLRHAVSVARNAVGLGDEPITVVTYARPASYRPNLYAEVPGTVGTDVNLLKLDLGEALQGGGPQFLYLWAPGW